MKEFVKKCFSFLKGDDNDPEKVFLTDVWEKLAKSNPDVILLNDDYAKVRLSAAEFYEKVISFAAGMQHLGLKKGIKVAQFSENSAKWMVVDQAIIACGALNAVRGSSAPPSELSYIYEHSESTALVIDDIKIIDTLSEFLNKKETLFIIYLGDEDISGYKKLITIPIFTFWDFDKYSEDKKYKKPTLYKDDPLTIVYSSGTTGKPKGVLLSHWNIVSQIPALTKAIQFKANKCALSVLPVWHMYERTCAYYIMSSALTMYYTNLRNFKKDLKRYKPNYMIAVPRIWVLIYDSIMSEMKEKPLLVQWVFNFFLSISKSCKRAARVIKNRCIYSKNKTFKEKVIPFFINKILLPVDIFSTSFVYKKVHNTLGGCYIKGLSGGGALPHYIEDFFEAIGIKIIVGYGLTETSPVVAVRTDENNKIYSVGPALDMTEFKIVDPETMHPLRPCEKGLVLVRGPQVMLGYYKDKEATDAVILEDGWFITGDLGWLTSDKPDASLVLIGRQKEIIVLQNGENIEATVLEDICDQNTFVDQIVLTGQDMPSLSALVYLNQDELKRVLGKQHAGDDLNKAQDFKAMLLNELNQKIKERDSFRPHERLSNLYFVSEGFTISNCLMTQSMKVRKNLVIEKYKDEIASMYKK